MIELAEALKIIRSKSRDFGTETINLEEADGRILAEDILADRDYPPFNRSAMDGYAIRAADWENDIRKFEVSETIFAGDKTSRALKPGQCYKIMTGAAVPTSADIVIRREDAVETGKLVAFNINSIQLFQNISIQGEDLKKNSVAIRKNSYCRPPLISTLASLGKTSLAVKKLPKVTLFTTGNEVKPANSEVNDTQIRNSNEWLVKSLLKKWQILPTYKHLPDNKEELLQHIKPALNSDIIILSGGVSAGDADFVPETLENLGAIKLFHKVQIRPGKPFWCGETPEGGMIFALPGNPFSTLVTFKLFVETFLESCLQHNPSPKITLPFSGTRIRKSTFDEFFPAEFSGSPSAANQTTINGSGDIRLGIYADAIAHHPKKNPELLPGTYIDCILI